MAHERENEGRTPVANPQRLLGAGVEHGTDDHEAGGDGSLAHSEDQANHEEAGEVDARGVAGERDAPDEDVNAKENVSARKVESRSTTCLIHLPTGKRCRARFCGYSKTR